MFELQPFLPFASRAVPLPLDDVDTDQISPGDVTLAIDHETLSNGLFRYRRSEDPDFVLERPEMRSRTILVAGANFGCGSSRESAVWALRAWGFRAVIATSFAEIFRQNALKNGLLPIALEPDAAAALWQRLENDDPLLTVDLESNCLATEDGSLALTFTVDEFDRHLLLRGLDELGYLLTLGARIDAYEASSGVHASTRMRLTATVPPTQE